MDQYKKEKYEYHSLDRMDVPIDKKNKPKRMRRYVNKKARQALKKETHNATQCD